MAFTSVEIIALILAVVTIVKILVLLVNKNIWYKNVVTPVLNKTGSMKTILAVIAIVLFYFLIQEFSIVEIFAVMFFGMVLVELMFFKYFPEKSFKTMAKNAYAKGFNKGWDLIFMLFWLAVSIWVLWVLLA